MIDYELPEEYLPYSEECEQSVLGGILIDNSRAIDVYELLTVEDFYIRAHQLIFGAIAFCVENNRPSDAVTVIECLESQNCSEEAGGIAYIAELAQETPSAANIMAYAQLVKWKSKERDGLLVASKMKDIIQYGEGTSEENLNNAYSLLSQMDMQDSTELTFDDMHKRAIHSLEERHALDGALSGISTGFRDIDKRTNGLQKTDLIIIAARPAQGKTSLSMNIAQHVAKNHQVVVFSMEQSGEQLIEKMWSTHGINMKSIKTGELTEGEWVTLSNAVRKTKALKLEIDERAALTPQQMRAKCLRLLRKYGRIDLIVVDYLQLMTIKPSRGETEDISRISGSLKSLAKEFKCPVIALSQLNRELEKRNNKRPIMSDLRSSGSIEQDADIIMFLYRDDVYAEQEGRISNNPGAAEINFAKFRGGETGKEVLKSLLQYSKFTDIPRGYNVPQDEIKSTSHKTKF
jgi:replicative DNA helicase